MTLASLSSLLHQTTQSPAQSINWMQRVCLELQMHQHQQHQFKSHKDMLHTYRVLPTKIKEMQRYVKVNIKQRLYILREREFKWNEVANDGDKSEARDERIEQQTANGLHVNECENVVQWQPTDYTKLASRHDETLLRCNICMFKLNYVQQRINRA